VLAGEAQLMTGTHVGSAVLSTGRLRALATTDRDDPRGLPDVPTVAESGYPGSTRASGMASSCPAATPRSITDRIRSEMLKFQQPDVRAALVNQGVELETTTPEGLPRASRPKPPHTRP
jgi:tripartite-type tricarboxylate transporter receptor subunit TctC